MGKSTLLNRLVGEHLAIVSPRPQTTRQRLLGIVNRPDTQLCLVDAPGVHRAKGLLNRTMVEAALAAITDVDLVLYLAEAGWPSGADAADTTVDPVGAFHRELLARVERAGKPVVLVLTKIDLVPKPVLLPLINAWRQAFDFREIYPLSALSGENLGGFLEAVRGHLPESPPLFPPDVLTDRNERDLCAEFIREQVFLQTHEEVPYGTAVLIEQMDESERWPEGEPGESDEPAQAAEAVEAKEAKEAKEAEPAPAGTRRGLVRLHALVVVERDSHKGIVIGRGGERLKKIGSASRLHIERLLGCRVWLEIHVRVEPGWTERRQRLNQLGLLER